MPSAINVNPASSSDTYYLLDLVAYNYTDRHIDSYSVNGQGGGNVFLSSRTSGGSGSVCCVRLPKDVTWPLRVHVRWQYDGCTYTTRSRFSAAVAENIRRFYKEADVVVIRPAAVMPKHLEAHFYPDGSVQVQLTNEISLPRLMLNEARPDKSSFPKCKDEVNRITFSDPAMAKDFLDI